ncbi:MAG: ATP-binding cassette domain-containing protein, partial [Elusimicrobiota bacterium]
EAVALGRYGKIGLLRSLTPSDRKAIKRALKITGLDALSNRPVGLLSGGEKQKTAVARAIAQEPELMLMDEPSTNLDLRSQRDIRNIIESIYLKEKVTIIYVTHILDNIPPSCSRTLMMKNGRIVWSGSNKDIYNDNLLSKLYGGDFYCAGGSLALTSVGESGRV